MDKDKGRVGLRVGGGDGWGWGAWQGENGDNSTWTIKKIKINKNLKGKFKSNTRNNLKNKIK